MFVARNLQTNATQKIATKEQLSADPLQDVQPGAEILVEKTVEVMPLCLVLPCITLS